MSATDGTQAAPTVLGLPRAAGLRTLAIWVGIALVGFPLGGYLGHWVAGPVDGPAPALIGGALTGAGIGLVQWLWLRRSLGLGPEWIVATSAGLAVGLAMGAMVVGYETTTSQLVVMGAISGAGVGIAQGLLLREKLSLWPVWIVAMPVLWALGWVTTDAAGIDVESQFTVFGASGAVAFGILSGLVLIAALRRAQYASS